MNDLGEGVWRSQVKLAYTGDAPRLATEGARLQAPSARPLRGAAKAARGPLGSVHECPQAGPGKKPREDA